MGKKIDSIIEMYNLGLPAPKCIFIFEADDVDEKLKLYFDKSNGSSSFTIRTDRNDTSMSLKRQLTATKEETIKLAHEWHRDYQVILQEFVDERNEIKSGNLWLKNSTIVIEGAIDKHINFTNGKSLDITATVLRFDGFDISIHPFFVNQNCFSLSELLRLIRLARKIPYTNAIVEFSFFKNSSLYFWEIKKN